MIFLESEMGQSRTLSIFSLAMINVAAIGTVKNWPLIAENGLSTVFFLVLAALVFFIPVSLVAAELATGWPKLGGVFVWVKEAFGHKTGFLSVWLSWVNNVIWYPTILSFIAAAIAYIFNPNLADHRLFTMIIMLILFWGITFVNLLGMRTSSWISTIGVVLGSFVPAALIIFLGFSWFLGNNPTQITFSLKNLIPDVTSIDQVVIFIGVLLTLAGMEMSAVHARDVKNPQRDYPKAILLSVVIILILSILGVLSIAIVVPKEKISLVAGSLQAFAYFVEPYGLNWMTPYVAALIAIGAVGSISTWTVGPTKGLLAAAKQGDLPPSFRKVNKHGMPHVLLIAQAVIVTILSLMFLLMPTINSAFWIITVMVAQLYLVMYILMFAAAIKLRYKKPDVKRAYRVPFGNVGMWIISGLGILSSFLALLVGFFPPTQITKENYPFYLSFLIVGMIITCLGPTIIAKFKKPYWNTLLTHEEEAGKHE